MNSIHYINIVHMFHPGSSLDQWILKIGCITSFHPRCIVNLHPLGICGIIINNLDSFVVWKCDLKIYLLYILKSADASWSGIKCDYTLV